MTEKKVAIMQPYLFPYVGYFQLVYAVDTFVFYDDVQFIKGGWINKNQILVNGQVKTFTLPLDSASSNKLIKETFISEGEYDRWRVKFLRTIRQSYSKAPFFEESIQVVEDVLDDRTGSIAEKAERSVKSILEYLGMSKELLTSGTAYNNAGLSGQERVIDICRQEGATLYINPYGGRKLYNPEDFQAYGIELAFLKPGFREYPQLKTNKFHPGMSMIDILMCISPDQIKEHLRLGECVSSMEVND